jgi:hypothetical protein
MDWRTLMARLMVCSLGDSALLYTVEAILASGDDGTTPVVLAKGRLDLSSELL